MVTIPIQVNGTHFDLWIILEDENVERIKKYDAAEVRLNSFPAVPWANLTVAKVVVAYATSTEIKALIAVTERKELLAALETLSRGWTYRPEKGDSDMPYQSPRNQ